MRWGLACSSRSTSPASCTSFGEQVFRCGRSSRCRCTTRTCGLIVSIPAVLAQLLTYLRLSGRPVGLVINFNTKLLTGGIRRVVNGLPEV